MEKNELSKKEANRLYMIEYRAKNKEKIKEINKLASKKYKEKNVTKIKIKQKEYREKNKEKIKVLRNINKETKNFINKEYYKKNSKTILKKQKIYNKNNKEKIKNYKNEYKKKRILTDPVFKLKESLKTSIYIALRRYGYTKKSRTHEILGCSYEQLKQYLESKFESWMNWNNHGLYNGTECYGWDIDHITPLSSAKTEDDIIKLNHYTNLQPLCSYVNRVIKKNNLT